MPKRTPLTPEVREQVVRLYDELLSVRETGRRLNLHENTVRQVLKASKGVCADCPTPILLGRRFCDACAKRRAEWEKERIKQRRRDGLCAKCDERIQPPSTQFCDKHRLQHQEISRKHVGKGIKPRHVTGAGMPEMQQREKQLRHDYGQAGVEAFHRDKGCCVLCGVSYEEWAVHMHHLDEDHTHNVTENLVCLCIRCHRLVHLLSQHPNPQHVLEWYIAHHPGHLMAQLIRRGQRSAKRLPTPDDTTTLTFDFTGS